MCANLGIRALASSAISGHNEARAATSNECKFSFSSLLCLEKKKLTIKNQNLFISIFLFFLF